MEQESSLSKDGTIDGHRLESYENVFDFKDGQKGNVAPGKDETNEGN